jgi:hypothetical protein
MEQLEKDISVLVCKLEKNVPSLTVQYSMQHLLVHLLNEAKVDNQCDIGGCIIH